jgi:hypothetical protein
VFTQAIESFVHAAVAFAENPQCIVGSEGVVNITEVDGADQFFRGHLGQQAPQRLALDLCVEVPDSVNQRTAGQMDYAFFRAEPPKLRLIG